MNSRRKTHLSGSDTNFRTSVDVDTAVGLTRDGRADSVDDTHAECTTLQAIPHRQDGIGGLTALADEHTDIITENGGLPVEEVRSKLNTRGDLRQLLEDRTSGNARVVARSARAEHDAAATADDREVRAQSTKCDPVQIKVDTTTHGVDDGFWLLVDLLLHEVVELALHDLREFELERLDRAVRRLRLAILVAAQAVDVQLALSDVCDIIVFKIEHALSVFDDRRSIGGDEEFNGLWQTIFGHECTGLRAQEVGRGYRRRCEQTSRRAGRN